MAHADYIEDNNQSINQLDPSMHSRFVAIFLSVWKDKNKKKQKQRNLNETLSTCILKMAGAICIKFGMHTCLPGRHLCSKCGCIQAIHT